MSSGLLALLDDVVALTKLAAATLDDVTAQAAQVARRPPAWSSTMPP